VVDDVIGAERLEPAGLLVRSDQADRRHAGELGELVPPRCRGRPTPNRTSTLFRGAAVAVCSRCQAT
jgi:hypothetical protein